MNCQARSWSCLLVIVVLASCAITQSRAAIIVPGTLFEADDFAMESSRLRITNVALFGLTPLQLKDILLILEDDGSDAWLDVQVTSHAFAVNQEVGELLDGIALTVEVINAHGTTIASELIAEVEGDAAAYLDFDFLDYPLPPGSLREPFSTILTYKDTIYGESLTGISDLGGRQSFRVVGYPQVNTFDSVSRASFNGFRLMVSTVPEMRSMQLTLLPAIVGLTGYGMRRRWSRTE